MWESPLDDGLAPEPTLSFDTRFLYAAAGQYVYVFNAGSGQRVSKVDVLAPVVSSPIMSPTGYVMVGTQGGKLFALNYDTGTIVWTVDFEAANRITATPAVGPFPATDVYVATEHGYVFAVNGGNVNTGSMKWERYLGNLQGSAYHSPGIMSSPAVQADGSNLYVGTRSGFVVALSCADGSVTWSFDTGALIEASPAIDAQGTVYIGTRTFTAFMDDSVYAFDGATGTKKWQFTKQAGIGAGLLVSGNGLLYFGSAKIHALNATTGAPVWEFPVINFVASSPVLGPSGILYVGGTDGRLWAITDSCPLSVPTLRALASGRLVSSQCPPDDRELQCTSPYAVATARGIDYFPVSGVLDRYKTAAPDAAACPPAPAGN